MVYILLWTWIPADPSHAIKKLVLSFMTYGRSYGYQVDATYVVTTGNFLLWIYS